MVHNFSIITPIYKTPIYKLERLYNSLLNQTCNYWEWIVYDDSPTDYKESYDYINKLAENDDRIFLYSDDKNCGIIGEVKRKAFLLGECDILVEVDHDDELVDTCLENLLAAYNYSDDIGFVYGHACEIYEDSNDILDYGDFFAFGYGKYRTYEYKDKEYKVNCAPNLNPKTIRHIVGIPNHVRSWKREIYHKIGGHDKELHVADDYELFVRTFLNTKVAKIDVFTYIQYFERNSTNTQFVRNTDIQNLVAKIANKYNKEIHDKFIELGIDDYIWVSNNPPTGPNTIYDLNIRNSEIEQYSNIIIPIDLLNNKYKKNRIKEMLQNRYAYSRLYSIQSTLEYKQSEHYYNFLKYIVSLTNCQSYLELGVEYGLNIQEIKKIVKTCVGVDITKNTKVEGFEFFQMTTDDFFNENQRMFDIIFIDANHNFEQVKKDFNNSLNILNKYGIIVIHDTDPIIEELITPYHCDDSYKIIDYISSNNDLNIITLPIQETGMTFVMRKNDRRINNFIKN